MQSQTKTHAHVGEAYGYGSRSISPTERRGRSPTKRSSRRERTAEAGPSPSPVPASPKSILKVSESPSQRPRRAACSSLDISQSSTATTRRVRRTNSSLRSHHITKNTLSDALAASPVLLAGKSIVSPGPSPRTVLVDQNEYEGLKMELRIRELEAKLKEAEERARVLRRKLAMQRKRNNELEARLEEVDPRHTTRVGRAKSAPEIPLDDSPRKMLLRAPSGDLRALANETGSVSTTEQLGDSLSSIEFDPSASPITDRSFHTQKHLKSLLTTLRRKVKRNPDILEIGSIEERT